MIHVHTGFRCVLEACTQLEAQGQAEHRGQFQGGLRDVGERLGLQQVLVVIDLHDGEQEGTDEVLRVLPFGVENLGAMLDEESLQTQQAPEAGRGLQAQHLYRFIVTLGVGVDAVQQAGPCLEVLHH